MEDEVIYESGIREFELRALWYEAWVLIYAVLAALLLSIAFRIVVVNLDLYPTRFEIMIILGMADFLIILFAYVAATYYPRRVFVYPDRISFKMLVNSREASFSMIESIEELSEQDTVKTFKSFRYHNLSPAVEGAVILNRKKGRPWVFSPEDPKALVAAVGSAMKGMER